MRTIAEADKELRGKLEKDRVHKKPGRGGSGPLQYLKAGGVALAMNEAFTPMGWDVAIDKLDILSEAHRINTMKSRDEKGTYWNAIACATVTVKARAMYQQDIASFEETSHTDVGVGSAVGGKATTEVDAYQNAITGAVTNAFKRACRFFGPKTGLTLQFEPGERESIQMLIDAMGATVNEDEIEGTTQDTDEPQQDEAAAEEASAEQTADVQAETPAVAEVALTQADPAPAAAVEQTQELFGPIEVPAVFKSFAGDEITRICALESGSTQVAPADVGAFHSSMVKGFGSPQVALGIWKAAGVTPGKGVVITRDNILSVAQVLDEASAGEGGLAAFLASLQPAPAQAPAPAQEKPVDLPGTATVISGGKHIAGPAPTAPAPTNGNGNDSSHGEEMQKMWDESPMGVQDRRDHYLKRFGESKREIVELLATVPDDKEVSRVEAGKVHAVGAARLQRLNQPATDVMGLWKQAGYSFTAAGAGQPTGKHLRAFADLLPD